MASNPNIVLSIISVTKNDCEGLSRTLRSISFLNTTLRKETEIVIVDGSQACLPATYLAKFELSDISITYLQGLDRSLYHAMNIGIQNAKGALLWFLNGGDMATPEIGTDEFANSVRRLYDENSAAVYNVTTGSGVLGSREIKYAVFIHQALIYPRSAHDFLGGYVEWPRFTAADFLFMRRLVKSQRVKLVTCDLPIALLDNPGLSAALRHFYCRDFALAIEDRYSLLQIISRLMHTTLTFYAKRLVIAIFPSAFVNYLKRSLGMLD